MIDGACGHQHHVRAVILGGEIRAEMGALEAAHAVGGAEDRSADRLVGKRRFLHEVEHDVLGRIHGRCDLLQDHVALAGKLAPIEARGKDDVAQDVEGEGKILAQHARVIGGGVHAGRGVELATDRLDLLGDVLGAAACGPFERHMLEEMGDAMLAKALAAAPGADPDAERHCLDLSHGVTDHGQAVGEL